MSSSYSSSSSMCTDSIWCSSGTSITSSGKIIGIVIGSLIGLAFLICIIITIYMVCCKRKSHVQVWAYPHPGSQTYGQPMGMYPYPYYAQGPMQPPPMKIIEEPPPAYEEISTVENTTNRT